MLNASVGVLLLLHAQVAGGPTAAFVGAGTYEEVAEGDFLEVVTKTERVVAHFFHREFERCKIMDKHLTLLAKKYFGTRFIKVSAPVSPEHAAVAGSLLAGVFWLGCPGRQSWCYWPGCWVTAAGLGAWCPPPGYRPSCL